MPFGQSLNLDEAQVIPVPDYVAFDLETTGLSPDDDEMLEIALVRFRAGHPADRWSTFVKPGRPVPLKTLRLTHISRDELEPSLPFSARIAQEIDEFRGTLPLVGHNSAFDTAFLGRVMPAFPGVDVYDTLELSRIVFAGYSSYRLSDLASRLGVPVTEAHRAYDDAEVAGTIFRLIQEGALRLGLATRHRIACLMGQDWLPRHLFDFPKTRFQPSLFGSPRDITGPTSPVPEARVTEAYAPETWASDAQAQGGRSREPDGLEPGRAGRGSIRRKVADLLHLSGADRVYSVPNTLDAARAVAEGALDFCRETGKSVLLVGFPEGVGDARFGALHRPGDYLCLCRFDEAMKLATAGAYAGLDAESRRYLASIASWAERTQDGLLSEVQVMGNRDVMAELACPADLSCKDRCPQADRCFALNVSPTKTPSLARLDGLDDVGDWEHVLVWEFQQAARASQRSEPELNLSALQAVLKDLGLTGNTPMVDQITAESNVSRVLTLVPKAVQEVRLAVMEARRKTEESHASFESSVLDGPPVLSKDVRFLESAALTLSEVRCESTDTEPVLETPFGEGGVRQKVLARRALWPGDYGLAAIRQAVGEPILLSSLSDTICSSKGLRRYFGLPDATVTTSLKPDLAGEEKVLFLQVEGRPAPGASQYAGYLRDLILAIAMVQRTGLQVLFPSRALIKEVHSLLVSELEERGMVLYAQGIDGGRRVLEHLNEEDTVVFSTMAAPNPGEFVPSCLLVAKVPFLPPNPLDNLRQREMSNLGLDPFVEVNVRQAALTVRAHVQRQIDCEKKSTFVLADPKACPGQSRWSKEFLSSFARLPKITCPLTRVASELSKWNRESDQKRP